MNKRILISTVFIVLICASFLLDKQDIIKSLKKNEIIEIKVSIRKTKKVKMYNVNLKEERLINDENYIKYLIDSLTKFKNVKPVDEKYTHDRRLQLFLINENNEQIMKLTINDYYLFLEEYDDKKYDTILYVPADFLYELALAYTNEDSKIFRKVSSPKIEITE